MPLYRIIWDGVAERLRALSLNRRLRFAAALSVLFPVAGCGSPGSASSPAFANANLKGNYSYAFSGTYFTSTGNQPYQEAGTFVADGTGNIAGGRDDFMQNSTLSTSLLGGTYAINKDGTGMLTLNLTRGRVQLAITLSSSSFLYLIEFDSFANGAGVALQQNTSFLPPAGTFVFHLDSSPPNANVQGSVSRAGSITVQSGVISGQQDVVRAGVPSSSTITGSITAPDSNGRGTAALTDDTQVTSNYLYYLIDAGTLKFLQTDAGVLGSGQADAQSGAPFTNASLNHGFAFSYAGEDSLASGTRANVAGVFTSDGNGNIVSGSYDVVQDGNALSNAHFVGTYHVESMGRATVTLNPTGLPPITLVAWIASSSKAFLLVDTPKVAEHGRLQQQQDGPFSTASLNGTFAFYMSGYDAQRLQSIVRVGVIQFDGSTNVTFTDYFVARNGSTAHNGPVSGSYTADGDGRIVAFSVGPTNSQVIYLVSNTSGNTILGANQSELAGSILQQMP